MDTAGLSESLFALARNHRWTWSPSVQSIFDALPGSSPEHHPVQIVAALDESQLDALLADLALMDTLSRVAAARPREHVDLLGRDVSGVRR